MNREIFRQYDIRGVWEKDLTEEVALLIGRAFGSLLEETLQKDRIEVSVGRDVRLSSPAISSSLISGIISTGVNVVDIGACPTPVQYFSIHSLGLDGGVMVTGSHNPPEYNGFKLSVGTGTIHGEGIQRIREIISAGSFRQGSGALREYPALRDYVAHLLSSFSSLSGITVVLDAGNGTAGLCAPEIAEGLGARVIRLYCEPDGRFPNHHPDPVLPENIEKLIQTVKETGADIGIAYDGDADRIGVVDADGEIVWGDRLMIVFSREILRESPGASIIGEVKCSQLLYDDIKKHGGNPVMWKTGHSLIKAKMKETGALIAGEMSGHIFFADRYFGYDDAIYATLRLLEILKKKGGPFRIREALNDLPEVFSTPEIRFDCSDSLKFRVVERIRDAFSGYDVNTTDGARIHFSDGWALARASNTQPALVLRFEARDEKALSRIRSLVEEELGLIMKSLTADKDNGPAGGSA
ncbi:MAG: phosphomannomutase/phosphoglucomutase [Nitrospiraceae bacterium]|nr:phosphomannomutase/phosphoglucomutase [Nitrospiraceae bacterium]